MTRKNGLSPVLGLDGLVKSVFDLSWVMHDLSKLFPTYIGSSITSEN